MKRKVYITGHKNPDTDSIVAAIAYAEYKNKQGQMDAIPIRLGPINRETQFILDHFSVPEPEYMETMKLRVADLAFDTTQPVESDISLKMAWSLMNRNAVNALVVMDEEEHLKGVVSISNVTQNYMDVWDSTVLATSGTTLENILDTLSAQPLLIPTDPLPFTGKMVVVNMAPAEAQNLIESGDVAITGNLKTLQQAAIDGGASLLIITGNHDMQEGVEPLAQARGVTVLKTPYDTFTAARLLPQAVPIEHVMTRENLIYFTLEDFIEDVSPVMAETRFRSYPILNQEKKVVGTLSRYHLISSRKKKIILVDHNERSQSIEGLDNADILEIIDHHRVADVATGAPIYFRNEPVGSTSTIIANIFFENGIRPSRKIAGLLCAAIISDTLYFKSPTATAIDRYTLERLAKIADLDPEPFAMDMFRAGTSLEGRTPEDLLSQDFKTFTVDDQKIGISQVYSLDSSALSGMKKDLLELMNQRAQQSGYTIYGLLITDIFKDSSELVVTGPDRDLLEKAFKKKIENNSIDLPGVLSRKKQVIPVVTSVILERRRS
ncbi:Manganese-dependent inorganic pyrophosphatase [Clostridiaceae bacterium JG1575]|nr:Manganese-dependent inorganic pyrophosphatase [Clostridiaceae bacterium JG1575]